MTLEPLERGFGHTLGNADTIYFRQCQSCAVTEVKEIDGILWNTQQQRRRTDILEVLPKPKGLAVKCK